MRIISVSGQKGGTGKTTSAAAIATGATMRGHRALLVDLDPQGSLTLITHADGTVAGSYDFLTGSIPADRIIQHREGWPDIIPASLQLAGADTELSGKPGRDFFLRDALEPLKGRYDTIVLDTGPTLGTLLINALTAADEVVIPVQLDTFATQNIYQLMDTIQQVQRHCNKSLVVSGVLITRYNNRTVLARDILDVLKEKCDSLGIPLFNAKIRDGVAVKEAQTLRRNLFEYAPKSNPALDYMQLLDELKITAEV
jgi:chromosome partitioning protein